jgi:hypothetical protein
MKTAATAIVVNGGRTRSLHDVRAIEELQLS